MRDVLIWLRFLSVVLAGVWGCDSCLGQSPSPPSDLQFDLVGPEETGIDFVHTNGATGEYYVLEPFTGGVAVFDYDGDGYQDIYFLNGAPLPGSSDVKDGITAESLGGTPETSGDITAEFNRPTNVLYRNNGDWTFTDVTQQAGVGDTGYGLGVVAGDFNNDGTPDLYISNFGRNTLYRNNGDGSFSDVTDSSRIDGGGRFGAGAVMLDIDNDGDLDVYCANYQRFTFDQHIVRMIGPHQFHPGPSDYAPEQDNLFRNEGDGTFADVSRESGIALLAGTGMGVIAGDFDQDGAPDIFVLNDSQPNFYFVNSGNGTFVEDGLLAGLASDRTGLPNGSMGVDCRDVNGDGLLDFVTTTFEGEMPVLYQGLGDGLFEDATNRARLDRRLLPHVTWGVSLEDFDNDADADLFVACGHFRDNIDPVSDRTHMKNPNFLMLNQGDGRFRSYVPAAEDGLATIESSRGVAVADLDNDGDLDLVILNSNAPPSLLRNSLHNANHHWLDIALVGQISNRQGIGARVIVKTEESDTGQVALVHAGRGYQSHYGTTLHFGLGPDPQSVRVIVRWPSGLESEVSPQTVDCKLLIRELD